MPYPFSQIEPKWQKYWFENKTFKATGTSDKERLYFLDMFPYPSGSGLHVGHPEGYTATDIMTRFRWMQGYEVLHPMGWDSFGLPAEQYALKTGVHPRITTDKNINYFREQVKSLGFAYDWDREISTCDPDYFRWTQWIFLKLLEKDLAYQAEVPVWWCPELGTVLANEEVIDGKSEVGGFPVERRPMRQWMLRITAFADRLLDDLEELDWPESIKAMQRNWIGRSYGAEVCFSVEGTDQPIEVFTTRPDTLFGATYMVLAPEHPLVESICSEDRSAEIVAYQNATAVKSDLERTELAKEKTGVFTGAYAINPVNEARIPIWVADYVLGHYGTGAIMAVPAHDQRDYEFAKTFDLDIVPVVTASADVEPDVSEEAQEADGIAINSGEFSGMTTATMKTEIVQWLEARELGRTKVNYRMRDWLFSRQRYWGEPIPVLHLEDGRTVPVPESELPVRLPEVERIQPSGTGESPLAGIPEWVNTTCTVTGLKAKRETNTMPQWAGSCWYYLRYLDPTNETAPFDPETVAPWLPVDLYVGGAEHAVLHLLYARFWHKFLFDLGLVTSKEPFARLVNQGMILGEDNQKMSKSRGNVINPDDIVAEFGADSLRCYEMYMGPIDVVKPWKTEQIPGVSRFLDRVWRLGTSEVSDDEPDDETRRLVHKTIRQVTELTARMRFNTALAAMMVLSRHLSQSDAPNRWGVETLVKLVSPYAPHLGEELWEVLGHNPSIAEVQWPEYDEELAKDETITIGVQVRGKLRATLEVSPGLDREELERLALDDPNVQRHIKDQEVRKVIVVPDRIVNIVV